MCLSVCLLLGSDAATNCLARKAPAGCSTTARTAGAAGRPGPQAIWRQPSFSGWRWRYLDHLSEGPVRQVDRDWRKGAQRGSEMSQKDYVHNMQLALQRKLGGNANASTFAYFYFILLILCLHTHVHNV